MDLPIEVRFWTKINSSHGVNSCWEWRATTKTGGYGTFDVKGKMLYAHRIAYEFIHGEIPKNLVIDHLCKNQKCCNPRHLEAVSQKTNLHRGSGFHTTNLSKTHCPSGHPYDAENTYIDKLNKRHCRACREARGKEWRSNHMLPCQPARTND